MGQYINLLAASVCVRVWAQFWRTNISKMVDTGSNGTPMGNGIQHVKWIRD